MQLVGQHPELAVNPRWRIRHVLAEGGATSEHTRHLCEIFGIEDAWLERYPSELSGGQLARVVCVRALAPTTRYIIADEATAMHDPLTQAQLWRALMQVVRERELGLVVISHDKHLLGHLCHRVIPIGSPLPM